MNLEFVIPIAVLVLWTSVMLYWMIATRWPDAIKLGYTPSTIPRGLRGSDYEGKLPDRVMWKSHNYTNLCEQPTIFYAIAFSHCLIGSGGIDLVLVWTYVALRILHSIWQAAVNYLPVRTLLFMLSDVVIVVLAVRAILAIN